MMNVGTPADPSVFPRIAGSANDDADVAVNNGRPAVLAPTSEGRGGEAGGGERAGTGDAEVVDGSERVRIQPIDTRIRLHFKQTQVSV